MRVANGKGIRCERDLKQKQNKTNLANVCAESLFLSSFLLLLLPFFFFFILLGQTRLAQGRDIIIRYKGLTPLPVKVDGEPWLQQEPGDLVVSFLKQSPMLCRVLI